MNSKIVSFAIDAHAKVNHLYDGFPYSVHLNMVFYYGMKYIHLIPLHKRDNVIYSIFLHDTIEDYRITYNDIVKVAGVDVADIVYALTNEKGRNRKERANALYYEGIRNTPYATFVKLCDRLANVKYGIDNLSLMSETYKTENYVFVPSVINGSVESSVYKDMVLELYSLFEN